MSDEPINDSGKTIAFFLGVLVGMLLCLGGGGAYLKVQDARHQRIRDENLRFAEMEAHRAEEEMHLARLELERKRLADIARQQQGVSDPSNLELLKAPRAD